MQIVAPCWIFSLFIRELRWYQAEPLSNFGYVGRFVVVGTIGVDLFKDDSCNIESLVKLRIEVGAEPGGVPGS